MIHVPVGTVPEGPIVIRLVQDSDRDVGAAGKTLELDWIKNDETSYTTLTSGTHYTANGMADGLYAISFEDDSNGQGLFDTVGGAVLRVTSADDLADEYYERFWIYTPASVPATPVLLNADDLGDIADAVIRRKLSNVRASSVGDSWSPGDEQYTLAGSVLATAGRNVNSAGTLNTYQEDESTVAFPRTLATDVDAEPVTGVG